MEALVLKYGLIYVLSVLLLYFCFKRFIYSLFDPLAQIILLLASMIALSSDHWLLWYVILCILAFWLGLFFVFPHKKLRIANTVYIENVLTLKLYTYFLYIVYSLSLIFVIYKSGIPLFDDNPTHSKISAFDNMGILRRISFIGNIIPINLILLYMVSKHKCKHYLFLLFLFCVLKILQGSKSSFLGIMLVSYYIFYISPLQRFKQISLRAKKNVMWSGVAIIAIILFFIVSKESETEGGSFFYSLGFRLMEFGDVMLYYKVDNVRAVFDDYNIFTYLYDEFNGVLGMLRLCPYKFPLGYMMVNEFRGYESDVITGPNGIFMIKGNIYFGYIGGIIYSFICGYVFALFRKYFFSMYIKDIFWYSLMLFIFFSLSGFLRESGQFYSLLFDWAFYTFPFLFIIQCLIKKYGKYRNC